MKLKTYLPVYALDKGIMPVELKDRGYQKKNYNLLALVPVTFDKRNIDKCFLCGSCCLLCNLVTNTCSSAGVQELQQHGQLPLSRCNLGEFILQSSFKILRCCINDVSDFNDSEIFESCNEISKNVSGKTMIESIIIISIMCGLFLTITVKKQQVY